MSLCRLMVEEDVFIPCRQLPVRCTPAAWLSCALVMETKFCTVRPVAGVPPAAAWHCHDVGALRLLMAAVCLHACE